MSDSRILADAIASLQARVDELEKDNAAYRRESVLLRLKLNATSESQCASQGRLMFSADDTVQMLTSASDALKDLRQLKRENRLIMHQQNQIEGELGKVLKENADLKRKVSSIASRINNCQETQYVYDRLILEMVIPAPRSSKDAKLLVGFMNTSVGKETYSTPARIQTLLQQLKILPIDFCAQRIVVKRRIVAVLQTAKDMIDSLNEEIEVLLLEAQGQTAKKRAAPVIDVKRNHVAVILQAMARFRIE